MLSYITTVVLVVPAHHPQLAAQSGASCGSQLNATRAIGDPQPCVVNGHATAHRLLYNGASGQRESPQYDAATEVWATDTTAALVDSGPVARTAREGAKLDLGDGLDKGAASGPEQEVGAPVLKGGNSRACRCGLGRWQTGLLALYGACAPRTYLAACTVGIQGVSVALLAACACFTATVSSKRDKRFSGCARARDHIGELRPRPLHLAVTSRPDPTPLAVWRRGNRSWCPRATAVV